ncbi:glycine cleavage system aminomethyltransferase GcvT [archaeon]|nr:MAG: glycine cleavage system aminomethyltransferase GcvT [archaeon]RLG65685.1 MAG: glycine cleavage system aminomethyltransferase GcvT [archaeon]HDM23573.1 glycine cleavage system aminomethyltransferase GcvT [Candidatus Bathyarchaeota archaeon]
MGKLKKTHFFDCYKDSSTLIEFAGWLLPVYFKSISAEHMCVRENVGFFDVSHMGRFIIEGPDSEKFLNYITTNNVRKVKPGFCQYSLMCNEKGGIIDDLIIYRLDSSMFIMVVNAVNTLKDLRWITSHIGDYDVDITNVTDKSSMLAVQGPYSEKLMSEVGIEVSDLKRFACKSIDWKDISLVVSRTGYTGEDGFELILLESSPELAAQLWHTLIDKGKLFNAMPCGLGARDSLRTEAGMVLYGNDIDENINPYEAKLGFVVKTKKGPFIGRETLIKIKSSPLKRVRSGFIMERGIARHGAKVYSDSENIGFVSTGVYSPLLRRCIGFMYISPEKSILGNTVYIDVRGRRYPAKISKWPFYDETKYGYRRSVV